MSDNARLVAMAREAIAAGDLLRAVDLVGSLTPAATPRERAQFLRVRSQLALAGVGPAFSELPLLIAEAETVSAEEPVLAALTLADAAAIALYRNDPDAAMPLLDRAARLAGDDLAARRHITLVTGVAHTFAGDSEAAARVLGQAMEPFGDTASIIDSVLALQSIVCAFASLEQYDAAVAVSLRAVSAARRVQAIGVLPTMLCLLANSTYFTGDYDTTLVGAAEALELAGVTHQPALIVFAGACAALAHGVRGNRDEVVRHVAEVRRFIGVAGMDAFADTARVAEGLLALGARDYVRAAVVYDEIDRSMAVRGRRTGVLQWRGDRVEALFRVGRAADARSMLDELQHDLSELPLSWSQTVAARCRGLLASVDWRDHLAHAVAIHPPWMSAFELGRTHLVWAERAHGEGADVEAAEHASEARRLFESVAARSWVAQAEELAAARPPAPAVAPAPAPDDVELRAFGPLTVVRSNVEELVPLDAPGKLLRYLVASGGRVASEHAIEALWPDLDVGVGAARLRNTLSRLRRQWGDLVVRDGAILRLCEHVAVDVARFDADAVRALEEQDVAAAQAAVATYRGELLPTVRYADWSTTLRERTRRTFVRLLRFLAEDAAATGDVDDAVAHLERAIEVDRYDDSHYLRAAEILVESNRPGAARRFLDRVDAICAELGVAPSEELRRLRERLLMTS